MTTVYLDHVAANPVDKRVAETMMPYISGNYGNPSALYEQGRIAAQAIDKARQQVASLINAKPEEIIFTSCGTESNNFALHGLAQANIKKGKHIITSAIEHFSIHHPLKTLEKQGFKVTQVPVDGNGIVKLDELKKAITPETILISITHASNEIGTIEPIAEISQIIRQATGDGRQAPCFHVDAVQAAGVIPVDVQTLGIDALSLAADQFYGPKGIAALYLKKGTRILPFLEGGIQEGGKRSGTENVSGIVGMGKAAELAKAEMKERTALLKKLQKKLMDGLKTKVPTFHLTGDAEQRLPNHVSGCVEFIEGESMSMFLDMEGISVSTGSACVSKALKASHVLLAVGVAREMVNGSIVFSFGKDTTEADIDYLLEKFPPIVERLQSMSPLKKG
ncbi:MAG: cysteine desulfurase [Candidatus Margulisbacteria bacterium]|nr:cysteine desulfurase [Candidatus Margulisiibacteriota bacterium]